MSQSEKLAASMAPNKSAISSLVSGTWYDIVGNLFEYFNDDGNAFWLRIICIVALWFVIAAFLTGDRRFFLML